LVRPKLPPDVAPVVVVGPDPELEPPEPVVEPADVDEPDEPAPVDPVSPDVALVAAFGTDESDAAELDDVPDPLLAVVVNVYDVPFVRPVTTHDVAGTVTVHVPPPGDAVTVYDVGAPPEPGATTVTVACPSPTTTAGAPGVSGGATGVTGSEATDDEEVPSEFVAVAVNVYDVPLVKPFATHDVAGEMMSHPLPGNEGETDTR